MTPVWIGLGLAVFLWIGTSWSQAKRNIRTRERIAREAAERKAAEAERHALRSISKVKSSVKKSPSSGVSFKDTAGNKEIFNQVMTALSGIGFTKAVASPVVQLAIDSMSEPTVQDVMKFALQKFGDKS